MRHQKNQGLAAATDVVGVQEGPREPVRATQPGESPLEEHAVFRGVGGRCKETDLTDTSPGFACRNGGPCWEVLRV